MTPEQEFQQWTEKNYSYLEVSMKDGMRVAYLAATKRTAQQCAEICDNFKKDIVAPQECARAIEKEYGL